MSARLNVVPGRLDLNVFRGASLPLTLTLNHLTADGDVGALVDVSPYQASLAVYPPSNPATPFDLLTSQNGRLSLGGTAGTVQLNLTPAQMAGYPPSSAWALSLIDGGGIVSPILGGSLALSAKPPTQPLATSLTAKAGGSLQMSVSTPELLQGVIVQVQTGVGLLRAPTPFGPLATATYGLGPYAIGGRLYQLLMVFGDEGFIAPEYYETDGAGNLYFVEGFQISEYTRIRGVYA